MDVAGVLDGKRVCICAGSGGVGKTTTSAAIALGMAARGLKVAVITIDPARRLANSLGLDELGNEPRLVDSARLAAHGLEVGGELWAMMLDAKRTFDEVIERLAPDARTRDEILSNSVYRSLSDAVAGTHEYTAIAKLFELDREADFDLLVLDTPPSRNALDFLEAPDRLTDFLEGRALRMLMRPAGLGARVLGRGTGLVLGALARVTGAQAIEDLSGFFGSLGGLLDGFRERARAVKELLADPDTAFVVVTSPEREPVDEAIFLHRRLRAAGLPFGGVVVNRVHHDLLGDAEPDDVAGELADALGDAALAEKALATLRDYHLLARRDAAGVRRLMADVGDVPVVQVPHFDADIHDVAGLLRVHDYLFAPDEQRERLLAQVTA